MNYQKPIRCWLVRNRYGYLMEIEVSKIALDTWEKSGCTVTPGFFIPDPPKKKARKKP